MGNWLQQGNSTLRTVKNDAGGTVTILPNGVRLVSGKRGGQLKKGQLPEQARKSTFTPETARLAAQRRVELAKERAQAGMMKAVNKHRERLALGKPVNLAQVPIEAYEDVIEHGTEVYLSSNSPKGVSDLGRWLSQAAGFSYDPAETGRENGQNALPELPLDQARHIINFIIMGKDFRPEDIIDLDARTA